MIAKFEKNILGNNCYQTVYKYKNLNNLPHWHTEDEIIFINEGCAELSVNNSIYNLKKGMSAFIKSGETHYIKSGTEDIITVLKIDSDFVNKIIKDKILISPVLKGSYAMEENLDKLRLEIKEKQSFYKLICESTITALIAKIFRFEETQEANLSIPKISENHKKLLEFISTNYATVTFAQAAEYMNFSQPYFSKYFYKMTGITFTDYLNSLKISAAIDELQNTNLSCTEISYNCGFGTIRNFNRVFKKLTGYNPKHLPHDFVFETTYQSIDDNGFIPTLNCSQLIDI